MKQLKKYTEDLYKLNSRKCSVIDETVEIKNLSPEDVIIEQAGQDKIGVAYGAIIKKDPAQAGAVLLDFAKQKYGLDDQGEEINGAGLEILNKKIDSAIIKTFPGKKWVIEVIKKDTVDNKQRDGNG